MATQKLVSKVWIAEGCIVCDACETAAPDVFEVQDETCVIRPEALAAAFTKPRTESIFDAAEECPVDVIKFETVAEQVADTAEAAPAAKPASTAEEAVPEANQSPQKPAAAPAVPVPTPAAAAKAPAVADASHAEDAGDPAIQALLRAATARGGSAGIMRRDEGRGEAVPDWRSKDPRALPPEAQHARIAQAARKAKEDPAASRRDFLSNAALTVGWTAFGVGSAASAGPVFLRFMMPNVLEEPDPRVRVGKLQRYIEMNPGDVMEDFKPQGIWMVREEERIAALSTICTHLGCIPNWLPNDRKFKCPCHGSGYTPSGVNFEGPTPRPLERFLIFVEEGIVVVDKSKKFQRELGQWDMAGSYLEA